MSKSPRISIPAGVRQAIFDRDGHQCQSCGTSEKLTVDHIVPLAAGGTNDLSNLQTLCAQCNRTKGKAYDPRFRRRFSL